DNYSLETIGKVYGAFAIVVRNLKLSCSLGQVLRPRSTVIHLPGFPDAEHSTRPSLRTIIWFVTPFKKTKSGYWTHSLPLRLNIGRLDVGEILARKELGGYRICCVLSHAALSTTSGN